MFTNYTQYDEIDDVIEDIVNSETWIECGLIESLQNRNKQFSDEEFCKLFHKFLFNIANGKSTAKASIIEPSMFQT